MFNSEYKEDRITIAFNPLAAMRNDPDAEIFAVTTPAIRKSKWWIPDIAELFSTSYSSFKFIPKYCEANPEIEPEELERIISKVKGVSRFFVGIIFYLREVLLTSRYEKRLFEHASQPCVAGTDIRLLPHLRSRTNLSRDSYPFG